MNFESDFLTPVDKLTRVVEHEIPLEMVTPTPSILPYAHHRGSMPIAVTEKGVAHNRSILAMEQQTQEQWDQIYQQMALLKAQAEKLQKRVELSYKIYEAECSFSPIIGHTYHLYRNGEQQYHLSLLSPKEWGEERLKEKHYIAMVQLLSDHTWKILEEHQSFA